MGSAAWSKDGSVFAVQLMNDNGFLHAYDFREHRRVGASWIGVVPTRKTVNEQREKYALEIEKLLASRGGIGSIVISDESLKTGSRALNAAEWRNLKKTRVSER